jgi:hypothetical protein
MNDTVARKYIRDLDGLLKEIKSSEEEAPLWETEVEEYMYESAIVFAFGRLYKFFNFSGIHFGMPAGLDCGVVFKDDLMNLEFEVYSKGFREHIKKGQVTPEDHKKTLVVCWKDDWRDRPSDIDVIELKDLWQRAKKS